ncbi:MAG: glycosyltransferase family 4 protein [Anaerolineae bacterium]|jgi:glycosyltransferase involved in cell wall biosynthesis
MGVKVAHIINSDLGLRIHGRNYFSYLQAQGYDLQIVCSPGDLVKGDMVTEDGIVVKAISFPSRYTPVQDLVALMQLVRHFRQQNYDIVHTHGAKPGFLGRIAASLTRTPVVVHTVHGFHYWYGMTGFEKRFFIWLERLVAPLCDSLMSQNQEDMEFAVRRRICQPEKIHYLGNGIDIGRFRPEAVAPEAVSVTRRDLGVDSGETLVGMIGRLVRLKGYFEYVKAAQLLHHRGERVRFLAIGATQDKNTQISAPAMIARHGLQGIMQFLGMRDDIAQLMAAMDIVVLPSYAEGIPRVLMEAAAMGKPAVGTDVRGTREVIVDGETGYLVPVRDAPALADAISRLASNPTLRRQMGEVARRRAEERFDERFYFWRTDREYRRLIKAKLATVRLRGLKELPLETRCLRG